jgi:flagellar motor switch protein FliM
VAEALSQSDIDSLLAAAAEAAVAESAPTPPGAGLSPSPAASRNRHRYVRKMDFARPSKFNKDQLRTLQMLHENFCRRASTYLSGTVRSLVEVNVTGAEQIPYGDFVSSLPVPSFTSVLEVAPLGTNAMASMDLPLVFGILDRMLGGPGGTTLRTREFTEIEQSLASTLMDRLLVELSSAWSDLVPVDFRLRGVEMNAQFAQIAAASEPSVLIIMELSIGTAAGSMSICLPYRSIEKVVGELTAHRYFATGEDEQQGTREALLDGLRRVEMPVRAMLGSAQLPVEAVLGLKPGDVIPLDRRISEGVRLMVGNTRTYEGVPGRDGRNVAVRIVRELDEQERAA